MSRSAATFMVASPLDSSERVVVAQGEIDVATAPELRDLLRDELALSPKKLIIDMADVSFIDSSGLSELVAFKAGETVGTDVILRNPSQRVRFVLEVSGLMSVLAVVPESTNGAAAFDCTQPRRLVGADAQPDGDADS